MTSATRRHAWAGLLIIAAFVPSASAQVFVSGGAVAPRSPEQFTDLYRSGYSASLGFMLESGRFPWARLRPMFSFQQMRTNPGPFQAQFDDPITRAEGGEMQVIYAGADLLVRRPFAALSPYAAVGIGLGVFSTDEITVYFPSEEGEELSTTIDLRDEKTGPGFSAAAGVTYAFSRKYELFLEAQYVYVLLDPNARAFGAVRLGMQFSFDY